MSQSRRLSAIEAGTNVVVGYALAVLVQLALFPAFGLSVALGDNLRLGAGFTLVSLARGYLLRRLFDRLSAPGRAVMGRRSLTLTPAQKAEVETLAAVLTAEQVADYFGIGRTTFFALIQRDPEIAERYKRGRARAVGAIAQTLIAKARGGDTACMIFFLKTQGGWRETQTVEHALPDPAVAAASSGADRLRAYLDAIALRQAEAAGLIEGEAT